MIAGPQRVVVVVRTGGGDTLMGMATPPDHTEGPDHPDAEAARVVGTEFGTVVLHARAPDDRMVVSGAPAPLDDGRCWRCDALPRATLDDAGLCPPCGRALRGPPSGGA